MTLLHRVLGEHQKLFFRVRDYEDERLKGLSFRQILESVGDEVYDRRTGRGQFLFYNAGCLDPFGRLDVIALGKDRATVDHLLERTLPALLERIL